MFDAQSLLGGLLKGAMSKNNVGNNAAMGMGALGIALAAFEHFTKDSQQQNNSVGSVSQPPVQLLKSSPTTASVSTAPPPPPGMTANIPPMAPPSAPVVEEKSQDSVLLLIDAMLAAANADGHIDADEELKILRQLKNINSSQEGFTYVQQKIDNPPSLEQICARVDNSDLAQQVYMVSLLAITVDTVEEEDYLKNLALCLQLDTQTIEQLNAQFQTKE